MADSYLDKAHRWGKISSLTSVAVLLSVPLDICLYYDVWPAASSVFSGLLKIIPLFWTTGVIEVLSFAPLLGVGGTYLSFVTGNITNLKLPCALNAMQNAKVKSNTPESEVIITISVATSAITTTVIIAVGVLLFSPILPRLREGIFAPAFQQTIPALFGALGAGYLAKHWRVSILPNLFGIVFLIFVPTLEAGTLLFLTVIVSLIGAQLIYKRGQKKDKAA